jgi:acyl carrier protein
MSEQDRVACVIKQFVLEEFLEGECPDSLKESTDLVGTGILDSLATLRLIAFIEERFGITIAAHEADIRTFGSVASISGLIRSKL